MQLMIVFASLIHLYRSRVYLVIGHYMAASVYAAHQRTKFSSFIHLTSYGPWPASVYAGSPTHKLFFFYKPHV
jgi:hypothetical protein